jgi:hypothetical protein
MKRPASTEEAVRIIETFDALPLEQRVDVFARLTPAAREELLEFVKNGSEIVRFLSDEEIYFSIKSLGEEHAPNLIAATSAKQLRYIADIDFWYKDMFKTRSAGRWLEILDRAGDDKLLQFVRTSDPELVLTLLRKFMKVFIRNPELDFVEEREVLPPFTIDDIFFVEFPDPDFQDVLTRLLEIMFRSDVEYYFGIMEELARGIPMEDEDMALKWRKARLADHGFPEFDEALEIYNYLQLGAISTEDPDDGGASEGAIDSDFEVIEYPLKLIESETLFRECLNQVDNPEQRDRIFFELAHLGNKVVIADGKDPGSPDDLSRSLKKVSGYINLALEESSSEGVDDALTLLYGNHMEILFRRGFSLILDLRKQAQRFVRDYEGGIENLGHPLAGLVKGLLQSRPVFSADMVGEHEPREFETLADIETIRNIMDTESFEDRWEPI